MEANVLLVQRWLWPTLSIPLPNIVWAASTNINSMDILHRDGLTTFWIREGEEVASWIKHHADPPACGADALRAALRREIRLGFAAGLGAVLIYLCLRPFLAPGLRGWAVVITFGSFSMMLASWVIKRFFSRQA